LKNASSFSRTFVLCVNDRPVLAFSATGRQEAQELCRESWLREDLCALRSDGVPLCHAEATLTIRSATADEDAAYQQGNSAAQTNDLALVYLVGLDGY
jgi:hypothetical protein